MEFPPATFEQLRQIVVSIRHGELNLPMGRKILHALDVMIDDPDMVAVSNIVELAEQTALSPASITRLSKLLGFTGFNQFTLLFKQKSKRPNSFYSNAAKNLIENKTFSPNQLIEQQF